MSDALPGTPEGDGAERVVLLHGFGGSARSWSAVTEQLELPRLALDLPGHGAAVDREDLSTVDARNAVIATLDARGIERAHLVGHSRGGAVAFLVAARVPGRIASLTLIAPGGCGEEIDAYGLSAFTEARTEGELRTAMGRLYAPARPSRPAIREEARHRLDERVVPALRTIREGMIRDGKQGVLDLSLLADAPYPITVLWGDRDAVLPVLQAEHVRVALPRADVRIIPNAGHMLPAETPKAIADAVRSQFRTNRNLPIG